MRRKRRKPICSSLNRCWLYGIIGVLVLTAATINCTLEEASLYAVSAAANETTSETVLLTPDSSADGLQAEETPLTEGPQLLSAELWADVSEAVTTTPKPTPSSPTYISLNVKDANLLDVLSLLAYKLDVNIIFLGQPSTITLKTENLSALTTLQLILQKEGYDYLTIGRNYIVGPREQLYGDFTNRMFLARYELFYVSASAMEGYITELGMPLQSLAVDTNQKALWMQGTPMTLGKARELINTLDVMENAAFAEGGARKIRMPVATASGSRAEEELEALIDLLSILLDGFRDGRTDMGWVTWDHPDPIPYINMDWESPIIKPYDIKMKITRDFANSIDSQIRYLIAEGTPDNINLVNQMIAAIASTPSSPFSFQVDTEEGIDDTVQWIPDSQPLKPSSSYSVILKAVPLEGGNLSGAGSYTEGSSVTVTAQPHDGYEFVRWIENGAEYSTSNTYTFSIYMNRTLEAVFVLKTNQSEETIDGIGGVDDPITVDTQE